MTVLDNINFFGAAAAVEMEVEEQLAHTIAEPSEAVATTFEAFAKWERAYIADINGEREKAVSLAEECLETTKQAGSEWKQAERAQADLISSLVSMPNDTAVRPGVRREFERLSGSEHVSNLKDDGLFAEIPVPKQDSMLDFGSEILPLDPVEKNGDTVADGDDGWEEIVGLFRMDQRMLMKIKKSLQEFEATVRECCEDVEQGQLFEANQYETHRGSGTYPVAEKAQAVRANVMSYLTFKEAYGTFMTEATIASPDDLFDETIEFVSEEDGESSSTEMETAVELTGSRQPEPADD